MSWLQEGGLVDTRSDREITSGHMEGVSQEARGGRQKGEIVTQ